MHWTYNAPGLIAPSWIDFFALLAVSILFVVAIWATVKCSRVLFDIRGK